jgi:flagellar hook-associated protein 3 FlgL
MRITNKMMTNNVLYNINGNKNAMSKLEEQYSTGMKIQRPSDDPIIATRALKLRTNLTELNQYYEKNIPDALAWMDTTESALNEANDILTKIHTYCVNGSTDTLTESDRNSIVVNLTQFRDQIFQEGNTNYAGRYVFSGYKTDTSLVFDNQTSDYNYEITEKLAGTDIDVIQTTLNSVELSSYDPADPDAFNIENKPNYVSAYRLRLAYNNLKTEDEGGQINIKFPVLDADGNKELDADGNVVYDDFGGTINRISSTDSAAYVPEEGTVNYLEDTGEIIMSEDLYKQWKSLGEIAVTYEKDTFLKNDLRPEHYFDCTVTDLKAEDPTPISYTKKDQEIKYEVNFSQSMTINTQGSDAITHDISRCIDDIITSVNAVMAVENKIKEVEKMLEDTSISESQRTALTQMRDVLKTEKTLKDEVLQNTFGRALTEVTNQQTQMNVAIADLGSRYARLELTESRLSSEQSEYEDLLSKNEDADIVDTVVRLNSQETIYNASLSAAAKVVKNSLLDFL